MFSVYLVCDDIVYGAVLPRNISYNELVMHVKKKFNIDDSYDLSFSYVMGTNRVRIVDDNDVLFLGLEVSNSKSTMSHNLLIQKVKLSTSNTSNFDLNIPLEPSDFSEEHEFKNETFVNLNDEKNKNQIKCKKEKYTAIDHYENSSNLKWDKNRFCNMPEAPDAPIPIVKQSKYVIENEKCRRLWKAGDEFDNKDHCMNEIGKKALDEGFEFKVRKSDHFRFDVICANKDCKWKIISKKIKNGVSWVLGTVNDIHTCPRTQINPNHRNATKKLLGYLIAPKLKDTSRIYKPWDIVKDINMEYNINITYKKAWYGKNEGLQINFGCPIESFAQLPYYFYNLKMANEGTVTHIDTDEEGRFKMCFVAFGIAIRSFLKHMRPLLITDGSHLKGAYKGTNLVLVGMDGNNQIIPIATGVSQGETGESWTWFLRKMKECIGEVPNLAIISDRHPAIALACNTVFPHAFHGYCCRHLEMNCKLKSDKLKAIFWKTCKAYTPEEFQRGINDLAGYKPNAYKRLEIAGFDKWSRAMCPANRYNYMTSNSAESINSLSRHVRKAPVMQLMEWFRGLLQKWYCSRREKYRGGTIHTISDWATAKITKRMQKSANWNVNGIEAGNLYQVDDRRRIQQVSLLNRTCSCRRWQLSGIPCAHVIAVTRSLGCNDCSQFVEWWFRQTTLFATYQELVYPVGEPPSWQQPEGLQMVKPPVMDGPQSGRPKGKKRIKSKGEEPIVLKCSRCGVRGHTRAGCHQPIANNDIVRSKKPREYTQKKLASRQLNLGGSLQYHESQYIGLRGQFQGQNQTMPVLFNQFNVGESSQQHGNEQHLHQYHVGESSQQHRRNHLAPFSLSEFNFGGGSQDTQLAWNNFVGGSQEWNPVNLDDP